MIRLNLGCGPVQPAGWANIDVVDNGQEHVADVLALPFDSETVAYAVANHVLNQLVYEDVALALREVRRVLRPGGWARLIVPNLVAGVRAHARGDVEWFPDIVGDEHSLDGRFCTWVTFYGTTRTVFTGPWLAELCRRIGFGFADVCPLGVTFTEGEVAEGIRDLDSRRSESVVVEAQK